MTCEHPGCAEAAYWVGSLQHRDGSVCVERAACPAHRGATTSAHARLVWPYMCTAHGKGADTFIHWRRLRKADLGGAR